MLFPFQSSSWVTFFPVDAPLYKKKLPIFVSYAIGISEEAGPYIALKHARNRSTAIRTQEMKRKKIQKDKLLCYERRYDMKT